MSYPLDQISRDVFPALVQFQQSRERREGIGQCISMRGEGKVCKLREAFFEEEDVCEGGISNCRLQLEDGHLAHRVLIAAESLHQLGHVDVTHGEILSRRRIDCMLVMFGRCPSVIPRHFRLNGST